MAGDLSPSQPQPQPQPQFQQHSSDADISSLLHTLLHNSSSQPAPAPAPAPPCQFSGSAPFSESPAFVDPTFPFSHSPLSFDHPDFHSEEDAPPPATSRTSSKRCRAAEVHNLSEKRRRQRINEKMKALQKLIPNSNKTDKASMLDEAIEYLKQLQLQVQMLTMRNYSSSSHPFYLPGALQSSSAALLNEGNSCRIGSFSTDLEAPVEAMFNLSSRPSDFMSKMSEDNNSGQALVPEPSMTRQYRSFNASIPSKLDMSHCGQSSSSGVSS